MAKARKLYNIFNAFNSFSFTLLSGNIIILYALRLNANSTLIGILNGLVFSAFFFMPLGKRLVRKQPIVRVFASAWMTRYILMIPLLVAPFVVSSGRFDVALTLVVVGVFCFHASRGIGMIGNNPVLNELATGHDRGSYMTYVQVINSAVAMVVNIALALLLGRNPPLGLYALLMGIGIIVGVFGSLFLYQIPEPPRETEGETSDFFKVIRHAFSKGAFRRFILILLAVSFVSSISRAFVVVYSREVYHQSDGMVALFTVAGGLGALLMGMFTRLLVDRVGAKPLYITYTAIAFISLIPIIIAPFVHTPSLIVTILFLVFLYFLLNFGFAGAEGVAQNYFFGLVSPKDVLDLGILYYIVYGTAGALGSFLAGVFLDSLAVLGFQSLTSYRFLFVFLALILGVVLFLQRNLIRLGALPLRGALGVIFSFRDIRAITLLDRLDKSKNTQEETALLEALHENPSHIAVSELLDRARSPRLSVRVEALRAIEALDSLTAEVTQALVGDVETNPYTTAYISARALGNHRISSSVPTLRKALSSDDYMLVGEAMVALAKIGDGPAKAEIEALIRRNRNPRVRIMGTQALEIYGSLDSLPLLLDLLREENPPPYLRDEVTIAIADLLGVQEDFYPLLIRYLEEPSLLLTLALDTVESAAERYKSLHRNKKLRLATPSVNPLDGLEPAVTGYIDRSDGALLSRWILDSLEHTKQGLVYLMAEAALDDDLSVHNRFRLLLVLWATKQLNPDKGGS